MKNLIFVFTVLAALFTFSSCEKVEFPDGTPKAIEKKIKEFSKDACVGAKVSEYLFQEKDVYLFDKTACITDELIDVYDKDGNLLGSLAGISGNVELEGVNFEENSSFVKVIWEKKE
ncbi:MAG: hypothetical protein LBP67_05825 [Bacteroidales bacterium]|jgi:hypothetical protein|nr:hypothetical protein [Bacteroidales bacterium]